jgi:alkylhydroperoxidase family enzyme
MGHLPLYEIETAPDAAKPLLEASVKAFGMLPGLHKAMAGAPEVLEAYKGLHEKFQQTSFNNDEMTVVWQTINVEHGCHYCVPAHSGIAKMMGIDPAINEALRNETPLADPKLEALRTFTLQMVRQRAVVTDEQVEAFFAAGFNSAHILELILGIAQKVMSNYINHVADTPVDDAFKGLLWTKADVAAE